MSIDFEALLAQAPNPYVVLNPDLRIVWMNEAYLRATMRSREDLIDCLLFQAFPSDPDSESHQLLKQSLYRVLVRREVDEIAVIRYDIRKTDGSMDVRYWSATHTPLFGSDGRVSLILQHTVDVTELHALRQWRDEMGVVQRAQAVQARNRDLAEESEQLRKLLEEAPGFVAVLSGPDHTFRMANKAYRHLVGQRDVIGKSLETALPEVIEQGFVNLMSRVRDTGRPHVARREKVLLRNEPTGEMEVCYLDFIYQPIVDEGGQVSGVFVQGHDVSEQVEAEEQQKLLINELNHRVKNTLAIVQGLAAQSFRKNAAAPDSLATFNARLAALAAAHSLLTEANWEAADLADIIRVGVNAAAGVEAERFEMAGPSVRFPPQAATAVAMVIHELSTNAVKYGALSSPSGRVKVVWSIEEASDKRVLLLDWNESGGPEVSAPTRTGFGTRLIKRGFASHVRSSVDLGFLPSGLRCRIHTQLAGETL